EYIAEGRHAAHFNVSDALRFLLRSQSDIAHMQNRPQAFPINAFIGRQDEQVIVIFAAYKHRFRSGFEGRAAYSSSLLARSHRFMFGQLIWYIVLLQQLQNLLKHAHDAAPSILIIRSEEHTSELQS